MYNPPTQMPMMPLAHMMNNPMAAPGIAMLGNQRKPDFPPDMQPIFVIPQIAHIKSQLKAKCRRYDSVLGVGRDAEWAIDQFEGEFEQAEQAAKTQDLEIQKPVRQPTRMVRKLIRRRQHREELQSLLHQWNPFEDANMTSDPYRTLFVGRLSFQTNEKKLRREFEAYGAIKQVRLVKNKDDKMRGYAFIEFEHKNDMKQAYKHSDGRRIDGRKIVVDIERGRTIMKWRPRRLGGGLGELRRSKSEEERRNYEERLEREREEEKRRKKVDEEGKKKRERSRSPKKERSRSQPKKHKKRKSADVSEEKKAKKHEKHEKSKKKHK